MKNKKKEQCNKIYTVKAAYINKPNKISSRKKNEMELYSIGTVVKLKNGEHKLMIISRTPLTNNNGVIGYYDYGACLYMEGQADSTTFFFNKEDIEDVFFEGYIYEDEEKLEKVLRRNWLM